MRLISFDVGIKNLAYCIFSVTPQSNQLIWSIPEWNCVNLIESDNPTHVNKLCGQLIKGKRKNDEGHICNKNAKWTIPNNQSSTSPFEDKSYCDVHAKMHDEWIIPKKMHTPSHINKLKLAELEKEYLKITLTYEDESSPLLRISLALCPLTPTLVPRSGVLANKHIQPSKKMKKSELVERITKYYESKCFRSTTENSAKIITAGDTDLVTIGRAIRKRLDNDNSIEGITHVIIENQISTIASRMKTIQGMIAQYFIMRFGDAVQIEFVSSHNKLKGLTASPSQHTTLIVENARGTLKDEPVCVQVKTEDTSPINNGNKKSSYKTNKNDGILICRRFFESNTEMKDWLPIFDKSKKRDDLADCFLQGIWYLKNNKIICYADNLKINSVFVS